MMAQNRGLTKEPLDARFHRNIPIVRGHAVRSDRMVAIFVPQQPPMKDYITSKQEDRSLQERAKDRTDRSIHPELPFFVRFFFPFCALLLLLKLLFHVPEYMERPVAVINVHGANVLSAESVRQFLNLDAGIPWFSLDPYALSVQLREHPWIDQALVHRSLPLTLDIHVTEREPIAFLQSADALFLLGSDFRLLRRQQSGQSWDLPIIVDRNLKGVTVGNQVAPRLLRRAFSLVELLKKDRTLPLDAVSEIIITDPFNMIVVSSPNGIRIRFGFEEFERKLACLSRLMPKIAENHARIDYIDLRAIRGGAIKYR